MKPRRKLTAIVMAAAMMMTMVPTAYAAEIDVSQEVSQSNATITIDPNGWDGSTTEDIPANGQISTAAQLAKLAADVNSGQSYATSGSFTIVADIDLNGQNFTPIGTRTQPFTGTLTGSVSEDGTCPTIKNANINHGDSILNVGVIGFVGSNGVVENLNFADISVTSTANKSSSLLDATESTTGVAVGVVNAGTLNNLVVENSCSVSGVMRTGGVTGDVSDTGTVINCENYASVTGSADYTGGVVGAAHNAPSLPGNYGATIDGCVNGGTVNGESSVAGIVGYADRSKVTNCTNSGTITGKGNYGTGGIVGTNIYNIYGSIFKIRPTVTSQISECDNTGNISAPRAGGILGAYVSAPGDDQPNSLLNCTITNCSNSGTISSTTNKYGAIFGYQISYAKGDGETDINNMGIVMTNCTNTGSPSSLSGSSISVSITGA